MNTRTLALLVLLGIVVYAGRGRVAEVISKVTRGLRNNNPGNIRHSSAQWVGKAPVQNDDEFVSFTDAVYGLRALAVTLRTYFNKYGLRTVRGIINRWAPPSENDTGAYVNSVARALQVSPDQTLDFYQHLPSLIVAIVKHENGTQPYSLATIREAISLM